VIVGQTMELAFTVENRGGGALWITPRTCAGDSTTCATCPEFSLQGDSNFILLGGGSATLRILFTPSRAGTRTCHVDFIGDCARVVLSGTGVIVGSQASVSAGPARPERAAVGPHLDVVGFVDEAIQQHA